MYLKHSKGCCEQLAAPRLFPQMQHEFQFIEPFEFCENLPMCHCEPVLLSGVAISKCKGVCWITQRTRFGLKIMIIYYFRSLISFDTINE